jgi:hypothetical protein
VLALKIQTAEVLHQLLHAVDLGAKRRLLHVRQGLLDGGGVTLKHVPVEDPQPADGDD